MAELNTTGNAYVKLKYVNKANVMQILQFLNDSQGNCIADHLYVAFIFMSDELIFEQFKSLIRFTFIRIHFNNIVFL